eukprot:m.88643 g.88643  ORF g.88643 m.88643 type:complete len:679 (-) comp26219_c3_seq1:113-2149(-)
MVDSPKRSSSYRVSFETDNKAVFSQVTHDVGAVMEKVEPINESPKKEPRSSKWNKADGTHLSWHNIGYSVKVKAKDAKAFSGKKSEKFILTNLTGELLPGEMMCIMGTSGSGKTSMLNVLSGRHVTGDVHGQILCNQKNRTNKWRRLTAYVEQDDLMHPHLTVKETLMYTALLRLPGKMPRAQKVLRVQEVINQLGLSDCQDTRIGDAQRRGISGGERKRTSIGIELIVNPSVLFLDEPTSGLDSYTAFHIMETVREICLSGKSVICSIHQPREKIFLLFDKILLLSQGQTCFYGPRNEITTFFSGLGHIKPETENVADFLLDTTTVDLRTSTLLKASSGVVANIQAGFKTSQYNQNAEDFSKRLLSRAVDARSSTISINGGFDTRWNLNWFMEFAVLFSRAWTNVRREPRTSRVAFIQAAVMGLVTGIVFYDIQHDQAGIRTTAGLLFFVTLNNAFMALQAIVMLFHFEKPVFNRERNAGCYRVSSYYMAKSMSEIPLAVLPILLYTVIFYWMCSMQNNAEAFFKTVFALVMAVITAQSFGLAISTAAPNLRVAQILAPMCTIILMLFGGFYVGVDQIPVWLSWLEAFSFMQYIYSALIHVQLEGATFTCDKETFCLSNGTAVLAEYGLDGDERGFWYEMGKCFALTVLFRFLSYIFLRFMHRVKLSLKTLPAKIQV